MRTTIRFDALLVGAVLLVGACQDPPGLTTPLAPEPTTAPSLTPASLDPATLARTIPGFGGLFVDAQGRPTVYLRDPRQRAAAEQALANFTRSHGVAPTELQVVMAAYDLSTLQAWFDVASPAVLAIADAVYADLNEALNRLDFGVATSSAQAQAIARLTTLGIPSDAYVVEIVEPYELLVTLRERLRPTNGGIQITSTGICTMGFNVTQNRVRSFITNSHCTRNMGVVNGDLFNQPDATAAGNAVGIEAADPAFVAGGARCPNGRMCRGSDAARIAYNAATASSLARIARPNAVNTGTIVINFLDPFFTITATAAGTDFTVGDVLNKVGRTTGWTQGPIVRTCFDVNITATRTLLCQTEVQANSQGGDSGSPVFRITDTVTGQVALYGILWGGRSLGMPPVRHFTFSPIASVIAELGPFAAF